MFDLYRTASETNPPSSQEVALRVREMAKKQALLTAQYKAEARADRKRRRSLIEWVVLLFGGAQ